VFITYKYDQQPLESTLICISSLGLKTVHMCARDGLLHSEIFDWQASRTEKQLTWLLVQAGSMASRHNFHQQSELS